MVHVRMPSLRDPWDIMGQLEIISGSVGLYGRYMGNGE